MMTCQTTTKYVKLKIQFFDEKLLNEEKIMPLPEKQAVNNEWEYLKKTVQAKDGKYLR